MNISKLITSLQNSANSASATPLDLMTLSRSVKDMKSGTIQTVANTSLLPTTLTTSGNVYYVESEEELYYNIGSTWRLFTTLFNNIYSWGSNSYGMLGDNTDTSVSKSSPVIVVGGITNWTQVAAGGGHSLAVTSTGILYSWGGNNLGQLGDGTLTSRSSPATVVGNITTWSQVVAGGDHSLGLVATGTLYSWGRNSYGQLGDNSSGIGTDKSSPVTVVGGITNWSKAVAGGNHCLGLVATGTLYSWGRNNGGQLGDDSIVSKSSPVTVVGGITSWSQISAGSIHSGGILSNGVAYTWGSNTNGRLGDNTTTNRSSPVTVVGGITNWSAIAQGATSTIGITTAGVAYAWGSNYRGALGDNTTTDRSSPVTVVGGIANWVSASVGGSRSHALTSTLQ